MSAISHHLAAIFVCAAADIFALDSAQVGFRVTGIVCAITQASHERLARIVTRIVIRRRSARIREWQSDCFVEEVRSMTDRHAKNEIVLCDR